MFSQKSPFCLFRNQYFKLTHLGESTAAGRLLSRDHFGDKLKDLIKGKLTPKPPAVWGTCSGLIMLANELENQKQGGQYHVSFILYNCHLKKALKDLPKDFYFQVCAKALLILGFIYLIIILVDNK